MAGPLYDQKATEIYDHWVGNGYYNYDKLSKTIANIAGGNRRLLELGIGTGSVAIPLAEMGYHIDGIDVSEFMLKKLATKVKDKHLSIKWHHQCLENIALNNVYNLIYTVGGPFWIAVVDGKQYLHTYLKDRHSLVDSFKKLYKLLADGQLLINVQHHGLSHTSRLSNGMDYKFDIRYEDNGNFTKTHLFYKKDKLELSLPYKMLELPKEEVIGLLRQCRFNKIDTTSCELFWVITK